jgi:hypothetical protein
MVKVPESGDEVRTVEFGQVQFEGLTEEIEFA